jgi:methylthioxylose transferase
VRSLCGELAARRLLPGLVLAPYAVWVGVSMDGVTSALCAASIAFGVLASEPGRRPRWAVTSGVLLGLATLFSYAAGWLAAVPLLVCFRRRRGTTIALLGAGALVPLAAARLLGFVWPDGLTAAQVDWSERIGPNRSWLLWAFLDLVLLVVACGPAVLTAARRLRRSPGWPFVLGALVGVGFAVGSGLARGEVERSWLPFFPWLLVPAVAPREPAGEPGTIPTGVLVVGAAAAVVIESVLRSAW